MKILKNNTYSEDVIFKGIINGDEICFKEFFFRYYPRFVSFANDFTKDEDTSEEIVTEVMTTIWEKRKEYNSFKTIKYYGYSSIKNKALNIIKHQKAVDKHSNYIINNSNCFDFNDKIIEEEVQAMLYDAIDSLPNSCKNVFKLNAINGLTLNEIAEDLNLSINTIKTHKLRATKFLREKLKELIIFLILFVSHL